MQFDVDVEKLIDTGIDINDYLFCQFVCHNEKQMFDFYLEQFDRFFDKSSINNLIDKGLLYLEEPAKGYTFTNIKVSDTFIDIFIEPIKLRKASKTKSKDEIEWFEEWYSLWPRGIKSGGYPVKGDRKGCIKKLVKFTNEHPEFGKDIIIKATKDYVDSCKLNRYNYMKLAHFFIYKDNMSTLASYCEQIQEKVNNGTYDLNDNIDYDNIDDI